MEIKEKYTSKDLVIMALENENTNRMVEDHEVDRWWLRNYWRKLTKKEKREWADALLFERVGDIIALGGTGILDGLKHIDKSSTYKVIFADGCKVTLRGYRKRGACHVSSTHEHQECAVLSKTEFAMLPELC